MKKALLMVAILAGTALAQEHPTRIFITSNSSENGVSSGEIGKAMDARCPSMVLTADKDKADYLLEAIDTGDEPGRRRNPYKFTLFNHDGDRVYSTATSRLNNAVKDVCGFITK